MTSKRLCTTENRHTQMATGLYIFCLSKTPCLEYFDPSPDDELNRLFLHRYRDLFAVAKWVSLQEFCGLEAQQRLEDPAWVTPRAIEHGRVIADVFRNSPVLPVPFGTLFSSSEALEQFLEQNAPLIRNFFEYAGGCEEWGVKALLDRDRLKRSLVSSIAEEESGADSPGLRYLRNRRAEQLADKRLSSWLELNFELVAAALGEYATELRQRRILDDSKQPDGREAVLNLAALITRDRVTKLQQRIEAINLERTDLGLSFALTGPWPPYSFCPALGEPR